MKYFKPLLVSVLATGFHFSFSAPAIAQIVQPWQHVEKDQPWPHSGSFYTDGDGYFTVTFNSDQPYKKVTNRLFYREGMEIDIAVNTIDFVGCTSWSNLPDSYDDCVTAGVDEPSGTSFGHGTHDHSKLIQGNYYWIDYSIGLWPYTFSPTTVEMKLNWQEVYSGLCPFDYDNPWCKIGTSSKGGAGFFFSTDLERFNPNQHWWNHLDDGPIP